MNATTFCDRGIASDKAKFRVFNWNVGVDNIEAEIASSKIYPNPTGARQDVLLEVESTIVGDAQITIYNGIGQEVMPEEYGGKNGTLEDIQSKDVIEDDKVITIFQKDGRPGL